MKAKKLIVWDHNRDLLYQRASTIWKTPKLPNMFGGLVSLV
jgi:glucosylceramidase